MARGDDRNMRVRVTRLSLVSALIAPAISAQAYDLSEQLSLGGVLAAVGQCQDVSARLPDETGARTRAGNECRGGMAVQVEVSLRPNPANELFLKLGFGADNGLNPVSPWVLVPWAADLEDNVKDINSSGRDYLLSAWYKHRFAFDDDRVLGASFGILDSTDYLDGNTYANDEYTQFMNEAFVNSGSYGLPSYAPGAGLEWTSGPWSLNAVGLNLAENDDGNNFNFWGVQAGYQLDTALGTGNYRLIFAGTSSDFLDPEGAKQERRLGWGLSFDQAFGETVGGFLRLSWQQEDAAVTTRPSIPLAWSSMEMPGAGRPTPSVWRTPISTTVTSTSSTARWSRPTTASASTTTSVAPPTFSTSTTTSPRPTQTRRTPAAGSSGCV
jgi:porin